MENQHVNQSCPLFVRDARTGRIRRITVVEGERLQGFPDGYTAAAGVGDGARYKAIGNSAAVPVVRWVGRRIATAAAGFYRATSAEFTTARAGAKRPWNLSADPVSGGDVALLSVEGSAGAVVRRDGELTGVFNYGAPGRGREAVRLAITYGARHLNCYDGFLVRFYQELGFMETSRVPFDDQYAPTGYDFERLGRPDVVFMERK